MSFYRGWTIVKDSRRNILEERTERDLSNFKQVKRQNKNLSGDGLSSSSIIFYNWDQRKRERRLVRIIGSQKHIEGLWKLEVFSGHAQDNLCFLGLMLYWCNWDFIDIQNYMCGIKLEALHIYNFLWSYVLFLQSMFW